MPPPYLWALFLHYQSIHLEASYLMKDRKYKNPFFHMFTFYGLPPSKLPKAAFQTAVGKDKPSTSRCQPSAAVSSPRFPATQFVKPTTDSSISYQRIAPSTAPLFRWIVTSYELQTAIALAERVSRGEVAGTSGLVQSNLVVTDVLNFVENLKRQGTLSSSQDKLLADARKVQFVKSGQLTTSVAARKAVYYSSTGRSLDNDSLLSSNLSAQREPIIDFPFSPLLRACLSPCIRLLLRVCFLWVRQNVDSAAETSSRRPWSEHTRRLKQ